MLKRIHFILCMLTTCALYSQFTDNFSDGDLTANPAWSGDVGEFTVNAGFELMLDAPEAGSSTIHAPITLGDSAEWEFLYRMEFAPSASNRMQVYLMTHGTDVSTTNGYYLEVGENGGVDALRFFRLDGGTPVELGASAGSFGGDPSTARIRVERNAAGEWNVLADLSGGNNFTSLFTANDATYSLPSAQHIIVSCLYTDTRKDKFFFDDFFAGLPQPDVTPPALIGFTVDNASHLTIRFDEGLEAGSAMDVMHYTVQPGTLHPSSAVPANGNTEVNLTFASPFASAVNYTLHIEDVTDAAGNAVSIQIPFQYIEVATPQPYDILVNEIMADPSPVIGLPNAEYIELHNASDDAFDLEDFALTVGTQSELLPAYVLQAGGFVLLVDVADSALFNAIPNKLAMDLPSLTNSGTTIELLDPAGTLMHSISYDINSYQDGSRDDGGWSLELINPLAPCIVTGALRASDDLTGGTPGRQNSVSANATPDTEGPLLVNVFPLNSTTVQLTFNEVLSTDLAVLFQPLIEVASVLVDQENVTVILSGALQENVLYTISVEAPKDCLGNAGSNQSLSFAVPLAAEVGDILLNEILFDPSTGGSRYVELVNVSEKYLDLSDLVIADIQGDTLAVVPLEVPFLIHPGAYVAIAEDGQEVIQHYFTHDVAQIVTHDLPSFDSDAGNVTVYTRAGVILDVFDYSESMHNALLDDFDGVALERLSVTSATQSSSNWYSASQVSGFGTPGLPNSQQLPNAQGDDVISIAPETFSPDQDGTDDLLAIRFPGINPGSVVTIRVYDAHGRQVRSLANNVSVGQEDVILWDGIDENGERARIGIYILWCEVFDAGGNVERYKRTCVLAERL